MVTNHINAHDLQRMMLTCLVSKSPNLIGYNHVTCAYGEIHIYIEPVLSSGPVQSNGLSGPVQVQSNGLSGSVQIQSTESQITRHRKLVQ